MNDDCTAHILTPADFASDQEVRWCPGCGDYSILKAVQRTLSQIGAKPENTVFVSGHRLLQPLSLLCRNLRIPHDPRPRAGDCHGRETRQSGARCLDRHRRRRRPVDRRQSHGASAAAEPRLPGPAVQQRDLRPDQGSILADEPAGTRSPSTPFGSVERPVNPCSFALGAGGRFVARAYRRGAEGSCPTSSSARMPHKGTSFVEIYQNCVVFNDGAFEKFAGKKAQPDALLWLEAGKPMLFAKGTKGLRLDRERLKLEVVPVADQNSAGRGCPRPRRDQQVVAQLLIDMPFGSFPMALGVIYCDPMPAFDNAVIEQNHKASTGKMRDLNALLRRGDTWLIDGDARIEIG